MCERRRKRVLQSGRREDKNRKDKIRDREKRWEHVSE